MIQIDRSANILHKLEHASFDKESWPEMLAWLSEHVRALEVAFRDPLNGAGRTLRLQDGSEE
ncbi:hypothetical protein C9E81_01365 [Paracoccus alkanivorans]|uniref:Uncharacterized protein n=1 Tax=Paracoccus alkanivorans TaxID=2116655 RepID=A0A3M0MI68_9RHOB|nr:hypothetical protein C9E81_01365 [Paracoccus alkanivorans]